MYRIDNASAVAALPAPAAPGPVPNGYFTPGNPSQQIPATIVNADWLNSIQEELMSILTAAGVAPSKTGYNNVLSSLQALFLPSGSLPGFSGTGHTTLPGGTIIQVFPTPLVDITSANLQFGYNLTFPVAFPSNLSWIGCFDGGSEGVTWGGFNNLAKVGTTITGIGGNCWALNVVSNARGYCMAIGN